MPVVITALNRELAPHFSRLNREWIEGRFGLEPADEQILANPQALVDAGGAVIFVLVDGDAVGTAALQKLDDETAELVKMAVTPAWQGRGLGSRLMATLIAAARDRGFARIYLETNAALGAANHLYRKFGFVPLTQSASRHGYARADVFYALPLSP